MTQKDFMKAVIEEVQDEYLVEFAKEWIAKAEEKTANRKPTKTQIENIALKEKILNLFGENDTKLASEIGQALDISTSKASSLCTQLICEGKLDFKTVKSKCGSKVKVYSLKKGE